MSKKISLLTFVSVLLLLAMPRIQLVTPVAAAEGRPKVALYNDAGVWGSGLLCLRYMFKSMNASVTFVTASDIKNGILKDFDLLVIPGGSDADLYNSSLGVDGASEIRDFVSNGGAFIGICAGAYFACDYIVWEGTRYSYPMGLFPGHGDGPIDEIAPWPNSSMTNISIVNHTHPITKSLPDYMWILYYGGPEFYPYAGANVTILGRYQVNGEAAIVACQYGLGRVFLSGPHPEIQEYDWPLLYEAVKWLLWSPEVNVFSVPLGEETYNVTTFSNSSLTGFNFNETLRQISFSVNGPPGTGFCNVTIPKDLLNCTSSNDWKVMLDDSQISASALDIVDNATHTSLYFTYDSNIHNIKIIATNVVPEYPTNMILPLFMTAISVAVILRKSFSRQREKRKTSPSNPI
jgi:glutamine amidotransferase-like uncharacterized protein